MSMSRCRDCGSTVREGKKFCGKCGATVAPPGPAPHRAATETRPLAPETRGPAVPAPAAAGWGQHVWNVFSIAGCSVISGVWFWYSGMAETKPDYKSCAAIILLPIVLIVFRSQIDRLLAPLQGFLKGIPRFVRLGIGIALPFLVANYLYARGYSQFDYMFKTVLLGPLLSYIVLRTPAHSRKAT